ncbi:MAG: glycosyltransferase [Anaerolineae bacterium]
MQNHQYQHKDSADQERTIHNSQFTIHNSQLSIVIPSLHSPIINRTLRSIRDQTFDLGQVEVIVVGQDRYGLVHGDALVRFIETDQPVAPAAARNLGLAQASGEIVVFIDADCVAAENWLANLMSAYRSDPDRSIVGGAVGFGLQNYWTLSDNISTFYRFLPSHAPGERPHLPSLNFSARRQALEAVGGFDERYPRPAGEDTDLCLRLRRAGHALYFEPRAVVYHQPPRRSIGALLRHARDFGRYTPRMRSEYGDLLGWPALLQKPAVVLALSPLLAAGTTGRIFVANPELRRYWYTAPAIFLAKLAWCVGAAQNFEFRISNFEFRSRS